MSDDGSAARRATMEIRNNPVAEKNANGTCPKHADGKPDFEKLISEQRLAYDRARTG